MALFSEKVNDQEPSIDLNISNEDYRNLVSSMDEEELVAEITNEQAKIDNDFKTIQEASVQLDRVIDLQNDMKSEMSNEDSDMTSINNKFGEIKGIATSMGYPVDKLNVSNEDVEEFITRLYKIIRDVINSIVKTIKKIYIKIKVKLNNDKEKAKKLISYVESKNFSNPENFTDEDIDKIIKYIGIMIYTNSNKLDNTLNGRMAKNLSRMSKSGDIAKALGEYIIDFTKYISDTNGNNSDILFNLLDNANELINEREKIWDRTIGKNRSYKELSETITTGLVKDDIVGKGIVNPFFKINLKQIVGMSGCFVYNLDGDTANALLTIPAVFKKHEGSKKYITRLVTVKSFKFKIKDNVLKKEIDPKDIPNVESIKKLLNSISETDDLDGTYKEVMSALKDTEKQLDKFFDNFSKDYSNLNSDQKELIKVHTVENTNTLTTTGLNLITGNMNMLSNSLKYCKLVINKYSKDDIVTDPSKRLT